MADSTSKQVRQLLKVQLGLQASLLKLAKQYKLAEADARSNRDEKNAPKYNWLAHRAGRAADDIAAAIQWTIEMKNTTAKMNPKKRR